MGRRHDEKVNSLEGVAGQARPQVRVFQAPRFRMALIIDPFSWELGCRRITPGLPYLNAVQQSNVDIIRSPIESICERGIRTSDGLVHELDVLICATGFDTSFSSRYDIVGQKGRSLRALWKDSVPEAYLGLAISGYPNYFSTSAITLFVSMSPKS